MKLIVTILIVAATISSNINAGKESTLALPKRPASLPVKIYENKFNPEKNNLNKFLKKRYEKLEELEKALEKKD
ncbi:hypothetical protein KJ644_02625 [Candidatus Dependentiae bacterium]|nr:hypothetical protein [Candidatus Dependentiae bacterium]MBU4387343.1 hypothetical protein [Candidatus Dependentiae bacterium]MCG2756192.1 hypothetical protein [Candidatus Dependentiae bacterium]